MIPCPAPFCLVPPHRRLSTPRWCGLFLWGLGTGPLGAYSTAGWLFSWAESLVSPAALWSWAGTKWVVWLCMPQQGDHSSGTGSKWPLGKGIPLLCGIPCNQNNGAAYLPSLWGLVTCPCKCSGWCCPTSHCILGFLWTSWAPCMYDARHWSS